MFLLVTHHNYDQTIVALILVFYSTRPWGFHDNKGEGYLGKFLVDIYHTEIGTCLKMFHSYYIRTNPMLWILWSFCALWNLCITGVCTERLNYTPVLEKNRIWNVLITLRYRTVKNLQTVNLLPWSCTGEYTVDQCIESCVDLFAWSMETF